MYENSVRSDVVGICPQNLVLLEYLERAKERIHNPRQSPASNMVRASQFERLQRLPWFLLGQLRRRQFSQLVIYQRQKFFGGGGIALLNLRQDACNADIREVAEPI